jgi:hypothetical protein
MSVEIDPSKNYCWKDLDLSAKYAELNTLRKIANDVDLVHSRQLILELIQNRIQSIMITLYHLEFNPVGICHSCETKSAESAID